MGRADHIVVCGHDGLAARVVEELRGLGEEVVLVIPPHVEPRAGLRDVERVTGASADEEVLSAAGVPQAAAVALLEDDDVGNLHAALAVQDLAPQTRLVVRFFNLKLGRRLEALFPDAHLLSPAEIAAPAFAEAALSGNTGAPIDVHGHLLELRETDVSDPALVAPVALPEAASSPNLFPVLGGPVLGLVDAQAAGDAEPSAAPRPASSRWRALRAGGSAVLGLANRRLLYLLGAITTLFVTSVIFFHLDAGFSWINSSYFTATTVTTTGYGDINLAHATAVAKIYDILLQGLGALMLAVLFAVITDAVVSARLARTLGRLPLPDGDHVIVCGMGNLGFRVIQRLVERGVSCVAVDPREDNPFLDAARRLGVPVVTADAAQEETLDDLRADRARALLAVTSDDLANLETALNGRTHAPQLPVVVRLYDADLADRVGRAFDIHVARSVSAIAGATFTARLVGRKLLATVPVGSRALVVAEVPAPGALTVGQLERRYGVRVLEADGTWRPDGLHPVEAGGALVVLGTKDAVGSLAPAA